MVQERAHRSKEVNVRWLSLFIGKLLAKVADELDKQVRRLGVDPVASGRCLEGCGREARASSGALLVRNKVVGLLAGDEAGGE